MKRLRGKWSRLGRLGLMCMALSIGASANVGKGAGEAGNLYKAAIYEVNAKQANADKTNTAQSSEIDPDPELLKHKIIYDGGDTTSVIGGAAQTKAVKSPFTTSTYCHAKRFAGYQVQNGIDVSQWQGSIDWNKVKKAGVTFAIIRVGYRGSDSGSLREDQNYVSYIKGALKAGIKVGVYIYSQATTPAEARAEANFVLNRIKGYNISMPVVLDYEFYTSSSGRLYKAHLTKREATDVCNAFCKTVEDAGYTPMVYGNVDMLSNHLYGEEVASRCAVWLANFGKNDGKDRNFATIYNGTYSFWQYTSRGKVPGIKGYVDCNFWYKNNEATGIAITDESVPVMSNTQAYLYHSLLPAGSKDNLVWTSSNPTVAYVKDGYVYGVSQGETTITATTSTGATDTCKITVTENMNNYAINEVAETTYTGSDVKPQLTVRSKTKVASAGKIKKETPLFAGPDTSYALVKTLSKKTKVTVEATVNDYYAVSVKEGSKTYYGYCEKSAVTAEKSYKKLVQGRDYIVKYSENQKVGTALAEAEAISDSGYNGTISRIFSIAQADINGAAISAISDQANSGTQITPKLSLSYQGTVLTEGQDYTVTYLNNQYAQGTVKTGANAQAVIQGKGNFTGQIMTTFTVCDMELATVDAIADQVYTGANVCPALTVRAKDGQILQEGVDYRVDYSNMLEVGDACATVTFLQPENQAASIKTYYRIGARDIANAEVSIGQQVSYQNCYVTPKPVVTENGVTLIEGTDYTLEYQNNYQAGDATLTIIGKGHYKGSKTVAFTIQPATIEQASVSKIAKQSYAAATKVTPVITLKNGNETLLRGRDYQVTYKNNKKRGKASVTITGTGNYTGSKTVSFTIGKKAISKCKIAKISNQKYKGKRICPNVSIRNSGKKLKKGRDYTLKFGVNKSVGKGTVTITGKGNYSGKKTISFRIVK